VRAARAGNLSDAQVRSEGADAPRVTLTDELDQSRRTRTLVETLIAHPEKLGPDFAPIRRLADDALVGWKATGRGVVGTELADTLTLLAGAASLGLVERLDWAFRCLAFDRALDAGVDVPLHITPEPETFVSPCPPRLAVSFGRGRRALSVAAEIHDDSFADLGRLRSALEEFRGWGWSIVLADVSDSPEATQAMSWLCPDVVQVDLSVPGRDQSPAVRRLLAAAGDSGAEVMALGVDSPQRRDVAVGLGATLARGKLLGAPGPQPYA
jgi:EAL domain-containing protein (putative c-di-GMP-specific phosphodiesterase class I)